MKLVIDRKVWLRGAATNERPPSRLLRKLINGDDGRCCVGIFLGACGVPDSVLLEYSFAEQVAVRNALPEPARWLITPDGRRSDSARELYLTNDDDLLSEDSRETLVGRIFSRHGISVEFVGGE